MDKGTIINANLANYAACIRRAVFTSGCWMECIISFCWSFTDASRACEGRSDVVHVFIARYVFQGSRPSTKWWQGKIQSYKFQQSKHYHNMEQLSISSKPLFFWKTSGGSCYTLLLNTGMFFEGKRICDISYWKKFILAVFSNKWQH